MYILKLILQIKSNSTFPQFFTQDLRNKSQVWSQVTDQKLFPIKILFNYSIRDGTNLAGKQMQIPPLLDQDNGNNISSATSKP